MSGPQLDAIRSLVALSQREGGAPDAEVAREFEALLATQLLRSAAKPLPGTRPLGESSAARIWRERFFEEAARQVAERGGFGIASLIERELAGRGIAAAPSSAVRAEADE